MRGPIPDKPRTRPTVPDVLPLVREYYSRPENGCGGSLHIVLDDHNLEDHCIAFCREWAAKRSDHDGVRLADLLIQLTRTQRQKLVDTWYD